MVEVTPPNGVVDADNPKVGTDWVELPNPEILLLLVDAGVKDPNILDGAALVCPPPPKENIELDGALVVVVVVVD